MEPGQIPLVLRRKFDGHKFGVIAISFDTSGEAKNDVIMLRDLSGGPDIITCRRAGIFEIFQESEGIVSLYPLNSRKIVIEATSSEARDKIYTKLRKVFLEGK